MPQERTKITIYDVAARAGVAISTVSRVLNDSHDVSEPTRARVLQAIEALQFRPDRTAKSLAQKTTRSLVVAVPTFTTPFHNELLKGIRYRLHNHDIDFLLCDLGSRDPLERLLRFLKNGAVDGLLLAGVEPNAAVVAELKALHAPVVLIGADHEAFDTFYWDDVAGARTAVEHLIAQGHRRIAMVRAHADSPLQERRLQGYRAALEAAGLTYDASLVVSGHTEKHAGFSEEAGYEAMQELLEAAPDVTAVYCSSDVQAIGAWKAIFDAGKKVPSQIAVVGYDDIKTSHYIGLSSVDQSMHEVGERATELLMARVNGKRSGDRVSELIVPRLVVRRSSLKV